MALPDKVEAVKKVSETALDNKQLVNPVEDIERVAPNKEHFQSLMNTQTLQPTLGKLEQMDKRPFTVEEIQKVETNPVFADENVSAQKSGTATDQERKNQSKSEEIEGIAGKGNKSKRVTSESLMTEVSKLNRNVAQVSQMKPEELKSQVKGIVDQLEQVKTQLNQSRVDIKPSYQTLLRNRLSHIDDNLKIALSKAGVEYTPPVPSSPDSNPVKRFINGLTNSQHQLDTLHLTIDKLTESGAPQLSAAQMISIQIKMGHIQQEVELFTNLLNKILESVKTVMNVQV